ncbi:MAG: hypothetical protein OXH97_07045 [Chloroflexota bacterium]|nr:hypothetical protein [Chloroflexota bacterium]
MAKRHRFVVGDDERSVEVDQTPDGVTVTLDEGDAVDIDVLEVQVPGTVSFFVGGRQQRAYVARRAGGYEVTIGERRFAVETASGGRRRGAVGGAEDMPGQITAPLAGVVVEIRVSVGDELEAGTTVLVLEAMKMQNEVQIPHGGTITAIHAEAGQNVDKGVLLVEYDTDGEE